MVRSIGGETQLTDETEMIRAPGGELLATVHSGTSTGVGQPRRVSSGAPASAPLSRAEGRPAKEAVKLPPRYPARVLVAFLDKDDSIPFWTEFLHLQDMDIFLGDGTIEDGRINLSFSIQKLPESPASDPDWAVGGEQDD